MRSLCGMTFGKRFDLRAMLDSQMHRPPNRRACPGTTPAQIVAALRSGYTPEELTRIAAADAGSVKDLRELAIKCMDITTRMP